MNFHVLLFDSFLFGSAYNDSFKYDKNSYLQIHDDIENIHINI